jgi:AcrR family transcriptional regulator
LTSPEPALERRRAAHLGPERRRPLVLDAAMGVFLERGYEGATVEEIARAAGVSKPVVYDCFSGKEELFKALFQREEARVLAEIRTALPAETGREGAEQALAEALTGFLRTVQASPRTYRVIFLGEGGMTASVARRIQAGREQQVEATASVARQWLGPDSQVDERAAQLLAQVIVSLAEAGARALLSDGESWTPETLGPRLARIAAAALPDA